MGSTDARDLSQAIAQLARGASITGPPADIATIAQACGHVWGDARMGPGADADHARWIEALALRSGAEIAWMGVGLGGEAAAMAHACQIRVTGYEWRPGWAVTAHAVDGRDVERAALNPSTPHLPRRRFDGALSVERLWNAPRPARMLAAVRDGLRHNARLCAVELVRDEGPPLGPADTPEPLGGFEALADMPAWRQRFDDAQLDILAVEDVTGVILARSSAALDGLAARFDEVAAVLLDRPDGQHIAYAMTWELNTALQKMRLLRRGDAGVMRFAAAPMA